MSEFGHGKNIHPWLPCWLPEAFSDTAFGLALTQFGLVVKRSSGTLYQNPGDADALERRGEAQFAMLQFGAAISDYREALRLRPERKELRLKRAKAEWLDGRDGTALRDCLAVR